MATIHDVAKAAGVSPTTVSRYINRRIELPEATATRIDAAISALDYRPSALAQRLSTGKSFAVGLVAPEIREPFFAEIASAVEDEADRHGYTVFITSTRSDRARELASLERLADRQMDGLLLMTNSPDAASLASVISRRRNVVVMDEDVPGVDVPRLFVENAEGMRQATRHLIEHGHRRIAYLGGPDGLLTVSERRAGFIDTMAEEGLSVPAEYLAFGSFAPEAARMATLRLLDLPLPPTAIIASSDYIAMGAVLALRDRNVSIPGDISLIAFDDAAFGALMTPPLTAIRQPVDLIGRRGFQLLLDLLEGREPPRLTRLPVDLIRRHSVGAPRIKDQLS